MNDKGSNVERSGEFAAVESSHDPLMRNQLEAAHSSNQSPSSMLKLNVDCFEELYEWISLAELRVLRATCRRLKQVVDYYIREKYPLIQLGFGKVRMYVNEFEKLLQNDAVDLKLIKEITIWKKPFTEGRITMIKEFLPQIEKLQISSYRFDDDFYESVLKWCTHLKYLRIYKICMDQLIGKDNMWLHRQYPMIEHIELDDYGAGGHGDGCEIPELKIFLELNPNIQTLSTTFHYFWENSNCWLNSNIKLDRLNVTGDCLYENGMDRICGLLNLLHEQGFYKRVHMYPFFVYDQDEIDNIISVKGLQKLYLSCMQRGLILLVQPDLNELCFTCENDFDNVGRNASNLMNVERVYFEIATSNVLQPFIRHAANVKEIQIKQLQYENARVSQSHNEIINVSKLNELRKELTSARKITIYVAEDIFLAIKWATGITDLPLVELKRAEAVEWTHEFRI